MKFDPSTSDPAAAASGSDKPAGGGIRSRVEAATKASAPAPKGKTLVVMILGVVVMGALIWDFTGRSGPSKRVLDHVVEGETVVAKEGPTARAKPEEPLKIEIVGDNDLPIVLDEMSAAALLTQMPEAERPAMRGRILEALGTIVAGKGPLGRQAFLAAARFADGAGPESEAALLQIKLHAYTGLFDDETAPAAILFLSSLPDAGGDDAVAALDSVIRNVKRPLLVRLAAARARRPEGRAEAHRSLIEDPATHPALREALR